MQGIIQGGLSEHYAASTVTMPLDSLESSLVKICVARQAYAINETIKN
jgi:hypothetical protein